MFIKTKELELRRLEFDETIQPGIIDFGEDLTQTAPLKSVGRAELLREHRGGRDIVEDIRVVGRFSTEIETHCARCLEAVDNAVAEDFDLVYRPQGVDARGDEASINQAETEIGYYQGEGLLLEDVLKEQILLALPVKQICNAACKGLCPQCGTNLNTGSCDCVSTMPDPRWSALQDIRKKLERS
jgi:DUF177 domain-containing protein